MNWETLILYFAVPAGLVGAIAGFSMGLDPDLRARTWGTLYFTPSWKTSSAKILRRAHLVADYPLLTQLRVFLPAIVILIPITILALFSNIFWLVQLFYFAAFILARVLMSAHDFSSWFVFPKRILPIATKMVGRYCEPSDALLLFNELSLRKEEHAQIAAINGYAELPTNIAIPALKAFQTSLPYPKKHLKKLITRAAELKNGIHPDDLTRMRRLLAEKKARSNTSSSTPARAQMLQFEIDEIKYTHHKLLATFPNLYCLDCFRFVEKMEQHSKFWVQCPNCLEAHQLITNIHRVIGQIGGSKTPVIQDNMLLFSLWDHEQKKAFIGDIHAIQIIGGQDINYDWAINSLLEAFHTNPPSKGNIEIVLRNSPVLEANTIRLLNEFKKDRNQFS